MRREGRSTLSSLSTLGKRETEERRWRKKKKIGTHNSGQNVREREREREQSSASKQRAPALPFIAGIGDLPGIPLIHRLLLVIYPSVDKRELKSLNCRV